MKKSIREKIYTFLYKDTWLGIDISTLAIFKLDKDMKKYITGETIPEDQDEVKAYDWTIQQYLKKGYFNSAEIQNDTNEHMNEIVVSIQNTLECPLNCSYCFSKKINCETRVMTEKMASDIVDFIFKEYQNIAERVVFCFTSGGEPLNNFDIIKYINEKAKLIAKKNKMDFAIGFTTNGVLLNEDIMKYLEQENISFYISADGNEDEHNQSRKFYNGLGTFQYVTQSVVRQTKSKNPVVRRTQAISILTGDNYDYVKRLKDLIDIGFSKVNLKLVRNMEPSQQSNELVDMNRVLKGYDDLLSFLKVSILHNEWKYIDAILDQNNTLGQMMIHMLLKMKVLYRCGAGKNKLSILPDGNIYPCDYFAINNETKIGDIYTGINPVKQEEWYQKSCLAMLPCKDCWARFLCGGSCYYTRYLNNGSPETNECILTRHLAEQIAGFLYDISESNKIIYRHLVERAKGERYLTHKDVY